LEYIETERLVIRDFEPDDWKDLFDYLSRPEVVKFEPYEVFTEAQCKEEAVRRSSQEFFRAVCLKNTGQLIGNVYFNRQEPKTFATWELGYVFNSKYWGHGYAAESCRAVLNHAFTRLQTRRVVAECNTQNTASWKLLERLHLRREGHYLKKSYFKCDENGNPIWQDVFEYAILSDEWLSVISLK
jgi:RimJ/RimL family protein N-acetyltransferase